MLYINIYFNKNKKRIQSIEKSSKKKYFSPSGLIKKQRDISFYFFKFLRERIIQTFN